MRWSFELTRLFGIPVRVHATFVLIVAWIAFAHAAAGESMALGALFAIALFACVLFHELGHALAARRYGIGTRDITLLPIGGLARLERMPDDPRRELVVALAGPAVNVAIAAGLGLWMQATNAFVPPEQVAVARGPFLERLFFANVLLFGFNLLPAFPMDGGRVLRAALAFRLPHARATLIAAGIGRGMAGLFGLLALLAFQPFLFLIALFVWFGATQEANLARMRGALERVTVADVMQRDVRTLPPAADLRRAADLTLAGGQRDFPVVEDGRLLGLLVQGDLAGALSRRPPTDPVGGIMRREVEPAGPGEPAEAALERLRAQGLEAVPVLGADGRLVGLLTLDNVGRFIQLHGAGADADERRN